MLNSLKVCIVLVITVLSYGCYEDIADPPRADFDIVIIDSLDVERPLLTDTVFIVDELKFINKGSGEYFVVWPDEKRVDFQGVDFQLTSDSWELMVQQSVPDTIIDKVRSLEGEIFTSESKFNQALFPALGGDNAVFNRYESQIKSAGYIPLKSIDGSDSTRFSFNHDYDDFQIRTEQGFNNVLGIPLSIDNNFNFSASYKYRLPGKYIVKFVALGVSDFGATTITSVAEKEIVVIAR